jgi:hypothetical protein
MIFPKPGGIVKPSLSISPNTQSKAMADIPVYVELDINTRASQRIHTPFHG